MLDNDFRCDYPQCRSRLLERLRRERVIDLRFDRVAEQFEEIGRNLDRLEQIVERTYRPSENGEH